MEIFCVTYPKQSLVRDWEPNLRKYFVICFLNIIFVFAIHF